MKLYELAGEILTAIERYNTVETDEDLQLAEEYLNGLQISFNDKAVGVAKFVLNTEADQVAIESEIKRLSGLKETLEKRSEWLRHYLYNQMTVTNTQEVDGTILKIKIKKNPPSVVVEDEKLIPEKYLRIIPEQKVPDKDAIKLAHKAGIGVAGTKVEQKTRLEIK